MEFPLLESTCSPAPGQLPQCPGAFELTSASERYRRLSADALLSNDIEIVLGEGVKEWHLTLVQQL